MKKLMLIITFLLIANFAQALTLTIGFVCWEDKLIEEFAKEGIILDRKNPLADGYIENLGDKYKIHLNKQPTAYGLQLFVDIPRKVQIEYERLKCQQITLRENQEVLG